ncbi:MAG TPA: thiamine phosphate synthase [Pyrinomonadaceae bacterium]|nr:thiamine phosphate synthase [Pyrinomonadaceae bacterium]
MRRALPRPISYLITGGETSSSTGASSAEFRRLLALVRTAADARVTLVQLREKNLRGRVLYELAAAAAEITRGSNTRVLVNDRADIARASGCDGVHLAADSLHARDVRQAFGEDFVIGVSTHAVEEAREASACGADFVVFGPVFDTPSKRAYGPPVGLEALSRAARELAPFPVVALGGISTENAAEALGTGAAGVAGIRLFAYGQNIARTLHLINRVRGGE